MLRLSTRCAIPWLTAISVAIRETIPRFGGHKQVSIDGVVKEKDGSTAFLCAYSIGSHACTYHITRIEFWKMVLSGDEELAA